VAPAKPMAVALLRSNPPHPPPNPRKPPPLTAPGKTMSRS